MRCFIRYFIATSKIAVTLDNCSKEWYNMSQGDEKNGQNAAQCGAMRGRKQLLNDEDKQHISRHISRRRHRAAVSAAVQPRYESDWDAVVEGKGAFAQMGVPDCRTLA